MLTKFSRILEKRDSRRLLLAELNPAMLYSCNICLFHANFITEVDKEMADSLAQLTARAQAAENAVDGLAR